MVRDEKCAVPELEEVGRTAKPQQPRILRIKGSLLLAKEVARDWDAARIKALQKDVDDKKAERETLLYVGYIRY